MLPPDLLPNWLLTLTGWSVLVVLWHSTVVALLLGMWRLWRRAAPARDQHVAALWTLAAVVALTAVTPIALMSAPPTAPTAALTDAPPPALLDAHRLRLSRSQKHACGGRDARRGA
jgi:hypothetical protein